MTIHVQSHGSTPFPQPVELAKADLRHGAYTLNGAAAVLADLFVAPRYHTGYPEATITPGVGWQNIGTGAVVFTGFSASAALLALLDPANTGFSVVVEYVAVNSTADGCGLFVDMGDYPAWNTGWSGSANYISGGLSLQLSDYIDPDVDVAVGAIASGKAGFTFDKTSLLALVNGGGLQQITPPDAGSFFVNPSFVDISSSATDVGVSVLIKSLTFYAPQTAAGLALLTV